MIKYFVFILLSIIHFSVAGKEYHVSVKGDNSNTGSEIAPFRTISQAASVAYPGDVITVHAGTYREWINPPRGGNCDDSRIIYRAAPGERVEIKGSEKITTWKKEGNGVWKATLPNSFFGAYNPYKDLISGDWFYAHNRIHHTGEVFLNNKSLYEMAELDKVIHPVSRTDIQDTDGSKYTWYCETDETNTTIWANFHQYNPNKEMVEISVRPTCFYPENPGINYLTIQGFNFSQAATQWAPPTAEQVGMIATHWNKGWIIEDNTVSNSKCSGITLGKERSTGQNAMSLTGVDGTLDYIEVIFKTLRHGWNKENIGSHIVRNNTISACEQTGICGSMGAAFSIIENNHIYDIWTKRQFSGAEIGGIKFHAAIDTRILNNRIHNSGRAVWLDWMTQGARVSNNLFYDNDIEDLFVEVSHGPYLVDNNILASQVSVYDMSQGGAYIHNLFVGKIYNLPEKNRYTPFHLPHSTEIAGFSVILGGDNRFFNNIFVPVIPDNADKLRGNYGLSGYDKVAYPMHVNGNVYTNRALPFHSEANQLVLSDFNPDFKLEDNGKEVYLSFSMKDLKELQTKTVDTQSMGKTKFARQNFEHTDGDPVTVDIDYLGIKRTNKPASGPFELVKEGRNTFKVW